MQYKNIIFDLGNVLVKLNPEGCIGAFKAIGMAPIHPSGLSFTRTLPKSNMIFLYCIIYTLF